MKELSFSSAIHLIEDAIVLVKSADSLTWLIYLCGAVPFFGLSLLAVTDLLESPIAGERLVTTSLGLALCFYWLHICQSVFCARLYAIETESEQRVGQQFRDAAFIESVLVGTKWIVYPLAAPLMIVYPSVSMFYQHALLPSEPGVRGWRSTVSEATRDRRYRFGQAVWLLGIVLLLRVIVSINLLVLLMLLPQIWKVLTGLENDVTRWPPLLLNPVAQCSIGALAYLSLDPIVKGACVLRRIERRAIRSGLDLRVRFHRLQRTVGMLVFCVLALVPVTFAEESQATAKTRSPAITAEQLDSAVRSVFRDPNEKWDLRVTPEKKPETNPLFAFIDAVTNNLKKGWNNFESWLRRLIDHANRKQPLEKPREPAKSNEAWQMAGVFLVLLTAAILFAWWRSRGRRESKATEGTNVPASLPGPDADDVLADDRPEGEWLLLAQEHRRSGNLRFSLRALYLSSLATLAKVALISVARGKSNLDYVREFERRGKRLSPEALKAFRLNVVLFEKSWYGEHAVTELMLDTFEQNVQVVQQQLTP